MYADVYERTVEFCRGNCVERITRYRSVHEFPWLELNFSGTCIRKDGTIVRWQDSVRKKKKEKKNGKNENSGEWRKGETLNFHRRGAA